MIHQHKFKTTLYIALYNYSNETRTYNQSLPFDFNKLRPSYIKASSLERGDGFYYIFLKFKTLKYVTPKNNQSNTGGGTFAGQDVTTYVTASEIVGILKGRS